MIPNGSNNHWPLLVDLFSRGPAVVLTGAGVSTDSGVPGYRDETGAWLGAAPMQFADFVGSPLARQRYWARSYAGFSRIYQTEPNPAHRALARLEQAQHVVLGQVDDSRFTVPGCALCGGVLKPDVVFFGERVPPERHQRANAAIANAGLLLVVGSSLVVNSGFRLIRTATQLQVPVVVLNRGVTRADATATLKFEGNAGELLQQLLAQLAVGRATSGIPRID